jgi:cytochrome c5
VEFVRLRLTTLLAVVLSGCLIGCGETGNDDLAGLESASRLISPADTALAEIYHRSCRSCHTIAATGAPLTGDRAAWSARLDKGMTTLVDNVINGFGGMPPFGMCMDCGVEEFEALIVFMANPEQAP